MSNIFSCVAIIQYSISMCWYRSVTCAICRLVCLSVCPVGECDKTTYWIWISLYYQPMWSEKTAEMFQFQPNLGGFCGNPFYRSAPNLVQDLTHGICLLAKFCVHHFFVLSSGGAKNCNVGLILNLGGLLYPAHSVDESQI